MDCPDFIIQEHQYITLGEQLVYTHVGYGSARIINALMEDNSYLNYDILSEFMFEKMMAVGHEDVNIKNVDNLNPFEWRDKISFFPC